jgi:type II secretory pathway component PulM
LKITARERKFLWAGGIICGVSLILYLVMLFVPSREDLAGSVEFKKKLLQRERETINREEFYKARVEQYKERLDRHMMRLLPGDNPSVAGAELQKVLKDLADQNGVEIMQRNVQREQRIEDTLVKVSVRIDTNCTPDELVRYLSYGRRTCRQ